jgi:predicted permease
MALLVSCLNVAGLLLIRMSSRSREFEIRRALGASHWRLARHPLLESLVLSATGAVVAVPVAIWMSAGAESLLPATLHGATNVTVDARAFAAMAVLSLLTATMSAFAPTLRLSLGSGVNTMSGMAPPTAAPSETRLRTVLVIAQIAVTLVLLAGAVSVVRKVNGLMAVDLGARGKNALVLQLELPRTRYPKAEDIRRFYRRLEEEMREVHGVAAVGSTTYLPGSHSGTMYVLTLHVDGVGRSSTRALRLAATPSYFEAIGIDMLAGRSFRSTDQPNSAPVAVASIGVARALGLKPNELVGCRIDLSPAMPWPTWAEIVGVVSRDVRMAGAEDASKPAVYVPFDQHPPAWGAHCVVRSVTSPRALLPALKQAAARVDPTVPLDNARTFDQVRSVSLADRRLVMIVMLALGAIAMAQAGVGLFAVMSYSVQRQKRELGIRIALGASPSRVRARVFSRAATHASIGIAAGSVAALGLWRLAMSRIPTIAQMDLYDVAAVAAGIVLVTQAATWPAARRASRVDPVTALRAD